MSNEDDKSNANALVKLMKARKMLRDKHPEKTGKNPIFDYFELRDFLPATLDAFDEVGLVSAPMCCTKEEAWIDVTDPESKETIRTFCPMSSAALPKCHPVQNLGATKSYLRRYIWMDIMEICEKDPVDSVPLSEKAQEQVGPTPRAKSPTPATKTPPRGVQRKETASRDEIPWRGQFLEVPAPRTNKKPNGEEYVISFIKFQLSENGEIMECACFKEDKITEAQLWPPNDEVIAKVRASIRNPGKFEYLGLEKIDDSGSELELAGAEKNEDPY